MLKGIEDPELRAALDWFCGFIEPGEWSRRRSFVESHIANVTEFKPTMTPLSSDSARVTVVDDQFAWYLFLTEAYLHHPVDYDFAQGSRVIPVFKCIGRHIDLCRKIDGVENRMIRMVNHEFKNPDSALFELLVALAYSRSGCSEVKFVPESKQKTPDLIVIDNGKGWFIECKRMAKSSEYSVRERKKWLELWKPLGLYLQRSLRPLILDIIFHVELDLLDSDYLERELIGKLNLAYTPGIIVDNDIMTVKMKLCDFSRVKAHLRRWDVHMRSGSLNELIAGPYDSKRGFTCALICKPSAIYRNYIEDISFAAGAVWSCNAEGAIDKKARDFRRQLAEAVEQLPENKPGIVHVGVESHDGTLVEQERLRKMLLTAIRFDPGRKGLQWVYCHVLDSRVPLEENWEFFETIYPFEARKPLKSPFRVDYLVEIDTKKWDFIYGE